MCILQYSQELGDIEFSFAAAEICHNLETSILHHLFHNIKLLLQVHKVAKETLEHKVPKVAKETLDQ